MKGIKHNGEIKKGSSKGGLVKKEDVYAGEDSDVIRDTNADGTPMRKNGGKIEGKGARSHLGRAKRKSGGSVGSDRHPIVGASAKPKQPVKLDLNEKDRIA